jgi:CRP-like cAMP-binding protein
MTDDAFAQFPLFRGFGPLQLDLLRPLFVHCEYHTGTVLFEQGDPATHFYLVTSGEVAIHFKPEDGQDIVIARIKPGGILGWSAVIGRNQYTSAAICTQFARLLRVSGADLQALCGGYPDTVNLFTDRLAEIVAERLQRSNPEFLALLENSLRNHVNEETE